MPHPTFDYAALSTLNLWLMTDSHIHDALQMDCRDGKLNAIRRGAPRFAYSRELDAKYDVDCGLARFEPALNVIDDLKIETFRTNTHDSVLDVSRQLSTKYGNNNVFAATTKLLWLKFRHPIIIYDERAADSLGVKLTTKYYDQWQARFEYHRPSVTDACEGLLGALQYVYDPSIATKTYVQELAAENWFQHRVFGSYLTFMGRNAR